MRKDKCTLPAVPPTPPRGAHRPWACCGIGIHVGMTANSLIRPLPAWSLESIVSKRTVGFLQLAKQSF
eukprot:scaffold700_cov560-Prasinococcus_capsulatus_cf.AAC.13